jgi:hypothetical protein
MFHHLKYEDLVQRIYGNNERNGSKDDRWLNFQVYEKYSITPVWK